MFTQLFVLSLLLSSSSCFSWDEENLNRLFSNSEKIFESLVVEKGEETCFSDFKSFVKGAQSKETWALAVLDSWAKEPAGLLSEVSLDFGHFDQCVSLGSSQQCLTQVENESQRRYKMGLCLPKSCLRPTLNKLLRPFLANLHLDLKFVFQCSDGKHSPFSALQWGTLALFSALILATLGATLYDVRGGKSRPLLVFSLHRNMNELFEQKDCGPTSCINGLRVLSILWIVLVHANETYDYMGEFYNPVQQKQFQTSLPGSLIHHGDLSVDTFFVIGGFLVTLSCLSALEKGWKFGFLRFYARRYLRLVPVWAAAALILVAFGAYFNTGPKTYELNFTGYARNCEKYWWSGLLLVQNHVNYKEVCLGPSWYISADFQFYLVSPLIILVLARYGRRCLPFLGLVSAASICFVFGFSLANGFNFSDYTNPAFKSQAYYPIYSRAAQWIIGMALGYAVIRTRNEEIKIRKTVNLSLWGLALGAAVCILAVIYTQENKDHTRAVEFAFFSSLHRPIWALAVAWVIFACISGHGGPVNWLLSQQIFQPLAKLSYAVLIIHVPTLYISTAFQRSLVYFNEYLFLHFYLGNLMLLFMLAIPFVLVVEMPLGKILGRSK